MGTANTGRTTYLVDQFGANLGIPATTEYRDKLWTNSDPYPLPPEVITVNNYTDDQFWGTQSPAIYQEYGPNNYYIGPYFYGDTLNTLYSFGIKCLQDLEGKMDSRTDIENKLIISCAQKVSDAKTNIAVALAEASKTSRLILDTATRVAKAFTAFKKGNFKGVAKYLDISSKKSHNKWLEYQYGWMPLIMDVKSTAEFFAQQYVSRPLRFSVSSRFLDDKSGVFNALNPIEGGTARRDEAFKLNREYRVKLWCEINNPALSQVQQLGITNPALIAWELVPFSFVFDWFLQVGDYLQAITAFHGVTVRNAMISCERELVCSYTSGYTQNINGYSAVMSGKHVKVRQRLYNRAPLSINLFNLFPVKDNPFSSVKKLISSLALLKATSR